MEQISTLLTKQSGLLGLTGLTSDFRYVEDNYASKPDAKRAMDVYCHRLAKYIASYTALMGDRLDAVVVEDRHGRLGVGSRRDGRRTEGRRDRWAERRGDRGRHRADGIENATDHRAGRPRPPGFAG